MIFQKWSAEKITLSFYNGEEVLNMPAKKRGNIFYKNDIGKRFNLLELALEDSNIIFTYYQANTLFCSFTYGDSDRGLEDWINIGEDWNRYISWLRKLYGKIDIVRVFA